MLNQIINSRVNFIGRLLENLKDEKFILRLETIFGGADLADVQLLGKYNKGIKYLLCTIDLFIKYACVVTWKDNRGIAIVNVLRKIISKERKPNKLWVDQGGEFYNNLFKRFLKINDIEMYSTYNERNPVVTETFIKKQDF